MADITPNYELKKPKGNENADISVLNENMDIIDEALGEKAQKPATVSGTLGKGKKTITLASDKITTASTIDIYASVYGIVPADVKVSTGQIVLTFDPQENDVSIIVEVK